jgi:hypothetical protein
MQVRCDHRTNDDDPINEQRNAIFAVARIGEAVRARPTINNGGHVSP